MRGRIAIPLLAALLGISASAQTFEVASVKPGKPDAQPNSNFPLGPGDVYVANGGLFNATALPLVTYIFFAYKIIGNQGQYLLPQLPDWVKNDKFDIQARASGSPGKDDMRRMMRTLLADRFKFAMHTEKRDVPVFAFVLAKPGKTGPDLQPHTENPPCDTAATPQGPPPNLPSGLPALCNGIFGMPGATGRQKIGARNVTLDFLANSLSAGSGLGRPMLNKTGLDGGFDFTLEWSPDQAAVPPGTDFQPDASGPTLQQALLEQFGIKLQSDKAPIDVYVLDHIEHPSEN
jgi:uncharacterized protein (TIGR03435 family)